MVADETEVPVVLRLFAQKTSSVNSVLQETKKGFNDLAGEVTAVAKSAAVVSASFTAALGGIVAAAVNVAGQFESLQAKLTSTLGSSEAAARSFQQALEFAAKTPFDVQGIVQATVQITAFGQSAQRILPLAANLAAAFGERVQDVGQILGKAFSGSLEGFESLRNRLGISNILLQKFGAELTKTGGISVTSAEGLRKAQDALEKIISTRFGDATARQSQTLFGALSNLSDSIQRVAAAFGTALIPIISSAARVLTGVVERFEKLSPATRQFIAVGALAAAGIGALTTGALALTAALTAGLGTLVSFAGALGTIGGAASGAAATAAGITSIGGAVSGLGASVAGAAASVVAFLGPLGALAALAGGAAFIAIQKYSSEVEQADKAVVAQARTLTEARNAFRDYIDTIEAVTNTQGKLIQQAGNVSQFAAALRASLANVTPAEFLAGAEKAGVSLDSLNKDLEKNQASAKLLKERVDDLTTAQSLLKEEEGGGRVVFTPEEVATIDRVRDVLGKFEITSDEVGQALETAQGSFQKFLRTGASIAGLRDEFQKTSPLLAAITDEAARVQDYLKFAGKTDDIAVLNASFNTLENSIGLAEQKLSALGIPFANLVDLQNRLLTGSKAEKDAIQAVLSLRDAQDNIEKKREADAKRAIDEQIRAEETGLERNKILFGENKRQEIATYQQLLGIVQKNSQEELNLLGKIATAKQGLKREEVARVKSSLAELVSSSTSGLEAVRATGEATATQTADAIKKVIAQLNEWGTKNAALIKQNPQLAQEFRNTLAGFQTKLDTAQLDIPKEKLREAIAAAKDFGTEAVTNVQKFAAATQARESLEKLANSGAITGAKDKLQLQDQINTYKKQELTLQQAITKETDAQNRQTAGVRRDGLAQEIEMLKQQQAIQGKSPFLANQIADKEKQLLAERVQAIREQEKAELDASGGQNRLQIEERTQLRLTQLQNEEVMKRISAEQNATSAFSAELQKRQAEEERFRSQRQGGPNSPLINLSELSATSGFLGNFSLGSFNDSGPGRGFGGGQPDQRQLLRVRQTVANDIRQGEVLAGRGAAPSDTTTAINQEERARQTMSGGPTNNVSVNISGNSADKPAIKALAVEALKELARDGQLRGLFG